jgi:hypothetical protein
MAEGEALDLLHGSALAGDQRIYAGDYARAADSDIFLITAGLRRKPDESRLDLINRNVELFLSIIDSIKIRRLAQGRAYFCRFQSRRYSHATGLAAHRPALEPGLWPGHDA